MKKRIYLPGIIALDILLVGTLFKLNHYPGAGILLITGFIILVLVFFPMALINAYRVAGNRQTLPLYIASYITVFMLFTGMLFKIMHWPGAGLLLMIDLPLPFVVFLPVFLIVTKRLEHFSIYKTIIVLLVLAFLSAFDALLALNVAKRELNDSMSLASMYHRTAQLKEENNSAQLPEDDPVAKSAQETLGLIKTAMDKLITASFRHGGSLDDDPYLMKFPDDRNVVTEVMIREGDSSQGLQLEESLSEFIDAVGVRGDSLFTREEVMNLLYFNPDPVDGRSWSERMFDDGYTVWSMVYLEMLRNNILLILDGLDQNNTANASL